MGMHYIQMSVYTHIDIHYIDIDIGVGHRLYRWYGSIYRYMYSVNSVTVNSICIAYMS